MWASGGKEEVGEMVLARLCRCMDFVFLNAVRSQDLKQRSDWIYAGKGFSCYSLEHGWRRMGIEVGSSFCKGKR